MKKTIVYAVSLFVVVCAYAAQNAALSQRDVRDPRKLEAILEANASDVQSRLDTIALTDTNTTVDTTTSTPLFAGQVLVGTVSNKVWVSKGTTTNDWVAVN